MKNVYFLILCGGGGERLWPLSRKKRPKQFIPFLNDKSLLGQTIDRIASLAGNKENIGVVTTQEQSDFADKLVGNKIGFILKEPASRNTAPAILYSCFELTKKNKDAVVVVLPADSFVLQEDKYRDYLDKAIDYASNYEKIVALGVMPTRPSTGYGYIQALTGEGQIDCGKIYDVFNFYEKPTLQFAEKYMQQKDMFWNIGVFISKISVFLDEFKNCAPDIFSSVQNYLQGNTKYDDITNISIDYAVMEKTKNVVVLPCDFEWSDVGNLDIFLDFQNRYSKKDPKIINIEGENNLAQIKIDSFGKGKMVAFIGVSDLCLVEEDDVILVVKRSEVEKVKELLKKMKKESLESFL